MATPTIDQFLGEIAQILVARDGSKLKDYLILEPPLPALYTTIVSELQASFASLNNKQLERLESKCRTYLPELDESTNKGGSWPAFIAFLAQYFSFLRDFDPSNLVRTHDALKSLLNACILALSDAFMGLSVLPTTIYLCRTLSRLAIGLEKQPELVAQLTQQLASSDTASGGESAMTERVTLVESTANTIREAFKKCLSERSGQPQSLEGRRVGIYLCANLCLKLFFHCQKIRSAEQIFGNIYQQSPPLSKFPTPQRVTYLYYLGRYHFANNHFVRAKEALEGAYAQCPRRFQAQRRRILVYLTTCNVILGRFPATELWRRPEAQGFEQLFGPLCLAIRRGDIASFRRLTSIHGPAAAWFLKWRILLQLRSRCEMLVWRSLIRKVFLITGFQGDATKIMPNIGLKDVVLVARCLEARALAWEEEAVRRTNGQPNGTLMSESHNMQSLDHYVDPDLDGVEDLPEDDPLPEAWQIECTFASLIYQDLLHGFVSHAMQKFVITGSKASSAREVGFPRVWQVLEKKATKEVPGWVMDDRGIGSGRARGRGGGRVVRLSGARPVGVGAG